MNEKSSNLILFSCQRHQVKCLIFSIFLQNEEFHKFRDLTFNLADFLNILNPYCLDFNLYRYGFFLLGKSLKKYDFEYNLTELQGFQNEVDFNTFSLFNFLLHCFCCGLELFEKILVQMLMKENQTEIWRMLQTVECREELKITNLNKNVISLFTKHFPEEYGENSSQVYDKFN